MRRQSKKLRNTSLKRQIVAVFLDALWASSNWSRLVSLMFSRLRRKRYLLPLRPEIP